MSTDFIVLLMGGMLGMAGIMLCVRKQYAIPAWKILISAMCLTLSGVLGAKLMFTIETGGDTGGVSFFGAVFFAPILMALLAMVLRVSVPDMLDLCAPSECIMLALLKVRCLYDGCCYGRLLYSTKTTVIRFPSQVVEMINAVVLIFILTIFIRNGKQRGKIYAWYLILYGVTRFVWNCFRETTPFIWILPAGHFWSLVSVAIGAVWLLFARRRKGCALMDKQVA